MTKFSWGDSVNVVRVHGVIFDPPGELDRHQKLAEERLALVFLRTGASAKIWATCSFRERHEPTTIRAGAGDAIRT